ncbi:MAG: hypothetical protein WBB29_01930 [Geitlerinemataceae cyanobacterium]
MLTAVLIVNASIALFGFYLAWHLWRFRQILVRVARLLFEVDRNTDRVLHDAPKAIGIGQIGTRQLGDRYRLLECYLLRLQTILALLNGGKRIWQRRGFRRISPLHESRQNVRRGSIRNAARK